ncbi:CoA transferase [Saccharomonospora sp. NPDC006951]
MTPRPTGTDVLPLAGIRVIDLTVVWSGPGATVLLGDLGAEVIRVEGNDRLSRQVSAKVTKETIAATGYHGGTYPDKDPGARPYDRSAVFNWHARNKLSACMNLDTPEGRQALLELAAVSDVLVENNSNGVLAKLGIGHERLREHNPRLIVASMPPLGFTGPMSDYLGYGPNFNSLVGIAAMDGYEEREPDSAGENYHMDEAAPAGLAFAVLAALWDRENTGNGCVIEFPQAENVMAEIGEYFLDAQVNGRDPIPLGNTDPHVLQDVFPSAVPQRWVAISVRDDRDWSALTGVLGMPGLAGRGATAEDRRARSKEIRRRIGEWCAGREPDEIVGLLRRSGVPSAEVLSEPRVLSDPHLAERGWFRTREHPAVGTHAYPGHPWRSEDFALCHGRPLPGFGQDNDYVYREVLGWPEDRYADQVARGLITDHQKA